MTFHSENDLRPSERTRARTAIYVARVWIVSCFTMMCAWNASGQGAEPLQVEVAVKIIEFQTSKGVDTGLSAYFAKLPRPAPFGRVEVSGNAINAADLTFPINSAAGITVFLDRIRLSEGDIEVILQALVDENRAFILSRPHALVPVGRTDTPSIVKTTTQVPYENTVVVGSTAVQVTAFEETGVIFQVTCPEVVDDDGDWRTRDDTYVHLVVKAEVKEEGQRIVVALDDQLAAGANFNQARNQISVPEFISRSIETEVWVREGQVLILGGLYRNTESRSLSTAPWLTQTEDVVIGGLERLVPGNFLASPISSTIGNRSSSEQRRELAFLIRAKIWKPAFTLPDALGFEEEETPKERKSPTDLLNEVIQAISGIPQDIAEGGKPEETKESIKTNLGGLKP